MNRRRYVFDGHTHTHACGHAYSTVSDLAAAAAKRGLELFCLTEHGPEMPGSCTELFFANYQIIPPVINNVKILKGIEANILDYEGSVDIPTRLLDRIEIRSASLHTPCVKPSTRSKNTAAVLGAIDNPAIDFICHLGNPGYELDYEAILQEAKRKDTLIEINNGSFFIRKGSKPNCVAIAKRCKELDIPIIMGTDTHFASDIGCFPFAEKALEAVDFPDELIMNLETKRLTDYLEGKGRKLFYDKRQEAEGLFDEMTRRS